MRSNNWYCISGCMRQMRDQDFFSFSQPVAFRLFCKRRPRRDQRWEGPRCFSLSVPTWAPRNDRYRVPVRSLYHIMTSILIFFRISARLSHRGQTLGQHVFPNWFRIVSHLKRRKNKPPATVPLSTGAPEVIEFSDDVAESQGMPIFQFNMTSKCSQ